MPRLRISVTFSHLWRLVMVSLMVSLYVIGMWSGILAQSYAYAASLHHGSSSIQSLPSKPARRGTLSASVAACPQLTSTPKVAGQSTIDGLGALNFYTFVKQRLNDRKQLQVNVANGNLVLQANDLHIRGTGIDLDVTSTYNSQSTASGTLGANWNLSVGNGVFLEFKNGNVILHGSSGFSATYVTDSSSYGGYDEPPGVDATLFNNNNGASYTLVFQKSGECFGFDGQGRETFDEDKNSNVITFAYNGSSQMTTITDTQNRVTSLTYDTNGRLKKITDPINRTIQYTYDSSNNLASTVDTMGKTTSFAYSGHQLTSVTDPENHTSSISYNTSGNVSGLTDATNATTSFAYKTSSDTACTNVPNSTFPCTVVTVTPVTTAEKTTYAYNGLRVRYVLDANGHEEQRQYTPDANVSTYTDALNNSSTFNFDVSNTNNLLSVTDGNGAVTSFGYSNTTNPYLVTTQQDTQGNTLSYGYDPAGNLTSAQDTTTNGTGTSASYVYNANGTIKSATDGGGHTTTYAYDAAGNLKTVTPPSPLGQETLVVDGVSRVTSETDGKGQTTSLTYDNLDRVTQITYNGGGTITYTFDTNGNETSVVDNTGTTSFQYDADNRITKKTLPDATIFSTGYDHVGNLTTFTDGEGTMSYTYTPVNLVATITEPGDTQSTTFTYNNNNQRHTEIYPNGVTTTWQYDKANHITSDVAKTGAGTLLFSESDSYFTTGTNQPTELRQTSTDNLTNQQRRYNYDSMNRLKGAPVYNSSNSKIDDFEYRYNQAGNWTSSTLHLNGTPTTYQYNAANELTSKTQGSTTVTYSYDGKGNLTGSSNGPSYSYNAKNQTTGIGTDSYTYSGPDQTERVQLNSDTLAYSGLGLSIRNGTNGAIYYNRCSCGQLVDERLPNGNKHYYIFDSLGSVVGLTDPAGSQLLDTYSYDPTGNILTQTGTVPNNWQYAGGYFNQNTGLTKFGTRYYDPTLGRWTQQDPVGGSLGNPDSLNRYLYAKENPVNFTDPSGRFTCVGAVIFAIISAISSGVAILGANIVLLEALLAEAALAGPGILLIAAVLIGLLAAIAATDAITSACYGSSFL